MARLSRCGTATQCPLASDMSRAALLTSLPPARSRRPTFCWRLADILSCPRIQVSCMPARALSVWLSLLLTRESVRPGHEHVITSDGFFELEDLPKSALVLGGGYIAVELAGVLNALGSKVTLSVRSKMLRTFDVRACTTALCNHRSCLPPNCCAPDSSSCATAFHMHPHTNCSAARAQRRLEGRVPEARRYRPRGQH